MQLLRFYLSKAEQFTATKNYFNFVLVSIVIIVHMFIMAKAAKLQMLERLDTIYICAKCKMSFLFKADTEDHSRLWGHGDFASIPLELETSSFKR